MKENHSLYTKVLIFFLIPMMLFISFFYYDKQNSYTNSVMTYEQKMATLLMSEKTFINERLNSKPLILLDAKDLINNQIITNPAQKGIDHFLMEFSLKLFNDHSSIGIYDIKKNLIAFHLGNEELYTDLNYDQIKDKVIKERTINPFFYDFNKKMVYVIPIWNDTETDLLGFTYTFFHDPITTANNYLFLLIILFSILMAIFGAKWVDLKTSAKLDQLKNKVDLLKDTGKSIPISNDRFGSVAKSVNDLTEVFVNRNRQNKAILDSLPFGVIFYNPNGEVLCVNQTVEKITGFTREEIKAFTFKGNILDGSDKVFWKTLRSGENFLGFESYCPTKSGEEIPVVTSTKPIIVDEYFMGTISTFFDVSEKNRLRKVEQHSKIMLDHISDGVITVNNQGIITSFNRGAEEMTGYKTEEVIGQTYQELFENEISIFVSLLNTLQTGQELKNVKKEIVAEGGRIIYLIVTTRLLKDEQGKILGAIGIYKDITPIIELESQVIRADKLAVIGELAAGTAHEIRNPLTTVQGFIQLMEDQNASIEKEHIKLVLDEIEKINEIIQKMLLLAKPSAPSRQFVSINHLINETITLMKPEANLYNISIKTELTAELPSLSLDENQVKQVLINIIRNGIQAMEENGGIINIKSSLHIEKKAIEIKIIDHGKGISDLLIKKIFDPFFTTRGDGTGLGIPVSLQIMQNHGGDLSIKSQVNEGTVISLYFPL